jgi:multidrug efflux pump subunit AcrA (membrane-fusion protein)
MSHTEEKLLPAAEEPKLLPAAGGEPPHEHHISRGKLFLVALVIVIVVAAIALAGYLPRRQREAQAAAAAREERTDLPTVTAAYVRRALANTEILLPGSISPLVEASIYARASGYVRKRYVDIGDQVRQGQLMADIETPELDQQVAQGRAAVAQAQQQLGQTQAALIQAQAQRDLAKVTSDRYKNLVERGAVARQDADTQETTYRTSAALVTQQEANVRAAQENVRQSQANLDRLIALQEYQRVRAPFTGIVTARNIDVGYLISATGAGQGVSPMQVGGGTSGGGTAGNEMYRVAQIGTLRILVSVPQANAPGIQLGMPAEITVTEYPGRIFQGKVRRTANSLDPNSRTMLVEVQAPNGDGKLLPGMYAQVRFRNHRDSPPLLIPGDALVVSASGLQIATLLDAPEQNGGDAKTKKTHFDPVQVGRDYGAETEILSGALDGQLVVVNPGDEVREGALVHYELSSGTRGASAKGNPNPSTSGGIGAETPAAQRRPGAAKQ